jgi:hypothetical protein
VAVTTALPRQVPVSCARRALRHRIHQEEEEATMPEAWSDRDERKYQHIRDDARDRGTSKGRAEELAARTVNKGRREEGRTPNRTMQGTGNPNRGYEARTKDELYNLARERGIDGRSSMNRDQLIDALRSR